MTTTDGSSPPENDLLDSSVWRPLRLMLEAMDDAIAALYDDAGVDGLRTRFVGPLIQLSRHEPMTIQELAASVEVTHSAMSQTVAAMRRAGLVQPVAGKADARTRRIRMSKRGREALPFLEAEWRATEATVRSLEDQIPYPLSRVVEDINAALAERPFADRLRENLAKGLDGTLR
jgi:DNA-binding MarR family transcriptional regulator